MRSFTSILSHRSHKRTHTPTVKLLRLCGSFLLRIFCIFSPSQCVVNIGWWLDCFIHSFIHWICIASCMCWVCQCRYHYHHDGRGGVVFNFLISFAFFSHLLLLLTPILILVCRVVMGVTSECHSFIFGLTTWLDSDALDFVRSNAVACFYFY